MNFTPIPSTQTWPLRRLSLKVLDLQSSLNYYTRLGLSIVRDQKNDEEEGTIGLGFGSQEVLSLRVLPQGRLRPAHTAGLYHFALLLPDEAELGSFLQHCLDEHIPLDGASDHLVSQALYLSDPEGNGIEVYADRPRQSWQWKNNSINMATLRLDMPALLKKASTFKGFPPESRLGHMHLNTGDLERSSAFYQNLGMQLTADLANSAKFLSWDGYHHHLGTNVWAGRHARPVESDVTGLDFFEIQRPGLVSGTFQDPDGITVIVNKQEM